MTAVMRPMTGSTVVGVSSSLKPMRVFSHLEDIWCPHDFVAVKPGLLHPGDILSLREDSMVPRPIRTRTTCNRGIRRLGFWELADPGRA